MKQILIVALLFLILLTAGASSKSTTVYDYPQYKYLVATGHGKDIKSAELDAMNSLSQQFALEITSTTDRSYFENTSNDEVLSGDSFSSTVNASSKANELYGVTIAESKKESNGTYSALAVLNKAEAAQHYLQLLKSERIEIISLCDEVRSGIGRFENVSKAVRYRDLVADYNLHAAAYNYLARGSMELISRTEADSLVDRSFNSIVLSVSVNGDVDGSIEAAIGNTLTSLGFRVAKFDARNRVDVDVSWRESSKGKMYYVNYIASVSIKDTITGETILEFIDRDREAHSTIENAYSRATRVIAKSFDEKIKAALK